jgi:hypothetical protein
MERNTYVCKTRNADLHDVVRDRLELRDKYPLVDAEEALHVHVLPSSTPRRFRKKSSTLSCRFETVGFVKDTISIDVTSVPDPNP